MKDGRVRFSLVDGKKHARFFESIKIRSGFPFGEPFFPPQSSRDALFSTTARPSSCFRLLYARAAWNSILIRPRDSIVKHEYTNFAL